MSFVFIFLGVCVVITVSVQYNDGRHDTVDPFLLPSGNLIKCHEQVLSLQSMIPPKYFDISPPLLGDAHKV